MVNISAIPVERINEAWAYISPFIKKGLDEGLNECTMEEVKDRANSGEVLVIIVEDDELLCVQTYEIVQKTNKKIMNLFTTGGIKLDIYIEELLIVIEKIAKNYNCDSIYTKGRKGWERKLKGYGYNHGYTILEKKL